MAYNTEKLVDEIFDSYNTYKMTGKLVEENILNKETIIEIVERLRSVLFPGFFDNGKVREEYIKYFIGDQLEFIQYNLKKQIAKALGSDDCCYECPKSTLSEKADGIANRFLEQIPKLREYLNTDVQAAFDGDPAAYSIDEIIFSYPGLFAL